MKKTFASVVLPALIVGTSFLLMRPASAQINLSWQDNSTNETQFTVERATSSSGPWSYCGQTGANVTTFKDNYVAAGTTYYYRVKASNATWMSKYTNLASKTVAAAVVGTGTGLKGQYYSDSTLASLVKTQTDIQVNFDWGTGSPGTSIPADNFTVRWSGNVQTQEGGTYSFQTETDDGVRLWINGNLVIDKWSTSGTFTAPVTLAANTKYTIKMEYIEKTGGAFARLKWTKPGASAAALIPKLQLFPS